MNVAQTWDITAAQDDGTGRWSLGCPVCPWSVAHALTVSGAMGRLREHMNVWHHEEPGKRGHA